MIKWSEIELVGAMTSTFMRGFKNIFAQMFFLLSLLAVRRDIAVTILLRCMCVRVCMHACLCMSIRICLGHNSYIYAWISKLFNTIGVLGEEKCHLKHFFGRLKVKVTLKGHINELFLGHNSYIYACISK